jgi:hypothetical protein
LFYPHGFDQRKSRWLPDRRQPIVWRLDLHLAFSQGLSTGAVQVWPFKTSGDAKQAEMNGSAANLERINLLENCSHELGLFRSMPRRALAAPVDIWIVNAPFAPPIRFP